MKILISTYLFVLLFGLMGYISIEFILMNRETNVARGFHEICVEKIENSYFDSGVIDECKRNAKEKGYNLVLEEHSETVGAETVPSFFVKLEYKISLPLLGIQKEALVIGCAG